VQSEESDVTHWYLLSPLALNCLGMNNALAGLSVLVCRCFALRTQQQAAEENVLIGP
jgi:hypothetical protein